MQDTLNKTYTDWYNTIAQYDKSFREWEARVPRILKRYRDDSRTRNNPNARFNILWSNVQVLQPAVFARLPRPDVSRRFRDNDPVARVASMMLERALEYEIEHYSDYASSMKNAVLDRLLGGRGTAWIRYEPHIVGEENEVGDGLAGQMPDDGLQITEDADESETENAQLLESQERIEYECAPVDYVNWRDFGHSVARTWEEVTAVWRKVYMSRQALIDRFGEELGNKIPLDTKPESDKWAQKQMVAEHFQACIYEIWDKEQGKVFWISKSMGEILDERDDPLQLEGFFPCPKPLYATLTTDSLEPIPDFVLYQDQAKQLDTLADRIDGFINALKVRGVYDASEPSLARLFSEGENNALLPVKNWAAFAEKQGMKGAIDLVDITPIAQGLMMAYQAMEQVKGQIYEIMGIADIQRGQTDPNETLGAQIIKSNNAAGRLKTMQHAVVDFATSLLSIKAQIICKHFTDDTILKISGAAQLSPQDQQLIPQALQLLKDEPAKNFRIEVTSDSMIYQDEQQEKADRIEFLKAVTGFMQGAVPMAQSVPEFAPVLMEMLKFGVTAFKAGKSLEGLIDETADKYRNQVKAMEGQPKPPPLEIQKIQAQAQAKAQELQAQAQLEMQKLQATNELEKAKQEYQAQENQLKFQLEEQRNAQQIQMEAEMAKMKAEMDNNKEILLAYLDNGTKIETARISQGLDDGSEAYIQNVENAKLIQDMMGYNMPQHPLEPIVQNLQQQNQQLAQMISAIYDRLNQPKTVIRDENGKIVGVK